MEIKLLFNYYYYYYYYYYCGRCSREINQDQLMLVMMFILDREPTSQLDTKDPPMPIFFSILP